MPTPTLADDQATIIRLRGLLNGAVTQMAGAGRMMKFDLAIAQEQLAAAEARVAAQLGERPRTRRLLTIQHSKGL